MIENVTLYPVNPQDARPFAQRVFELAGDRSNPRVWYRMKLAANHLEIRDLEQQAQAKGDELSHGKTSPNHN